MEANPGFDAAKASSTGHDMSEAELDVVAKVYEWPSVLQTAAATYNPADIAHYSYDLAKLYNTFYQDHQIVRETNESARHFRLALTFKTGEVIREAMRLLGIGMPDRM
jgi:arginyl-tRNA synthetase